MEQPSYTEEQLATIRRIIEAVAASDGRTLCQCPTVQRMKRSYRYEMVVEHTADCPVTLARHLLAAQEASK